MKKNILTGRPAQRAIAIIGVLGLLVAGFAALTVSNMRYDQSNPRTRPHSYYSQLSVEVDRPLDQVYAFVKYQIPGIYTEMSGMHEKFEIVNAHGLVVGAEIDCVEGSPAEVVHNYYLVTNEIENKLIQLESTPSLVYDRETNRKIGESNAYVYFDFAAVDDSRTRLTQTIVLDMQNPLYKSLGDIVGYLSGSRALWDHHFHEELEQLAAHIERS